MQQRAAASDEAATAAATAAAVQDSVKVVKRWLRQYHKPDLAHLYSMI